MLIIACIYSGYFKHLSCLLKVLEVFKNRECFQFVFIWNLFDQSIESLLESLLYFLICSIKLKQPQLNTAALNCNPQPLSLNIIWAKANTHINIFFHADFLSFVCVSNLSKSDQLLLMDTICISWPLNIDKITNTQDCCRTFTRCVSFTHLDDYICIWQGASVTSCLQLPVQPSSWLLTLYSVDTGVSSESQNISCHKHHCSEPSLPQLCFHQ